jgi:hypothetical protein
MVSKQKSVNVVFADAYVGCGTLANIMGLHEETVRKRAKRGQIPGALVNGKWMFQHSELVARGVQPFASNPVPGTSAPRVPAAVAPQTRNKTHVVFVLDSSGSMNGLIGHARKNLADQLELLRRSAGPLDEYRVSAVVFDGQMRVTLVAADVTGIAYVSSESLYPYLGGNTAMTDAIIEAIGVAQSTNDPDQAVLISVITDGGENGSKAPVSQLIALVSDRIATGRYTFAYAGPRGSESYAALIGVPRGNVTTWEQTATGTVVLGQTQRASIDTYAHARSRGVLNSVSFYAQPVTKDAQDFARKLDRELTKLDPGKFRVERVTDSDPIVIRSFCESKLGGFHKGKIYYQLTASEKVQDYKAVVIQDTATGAFYAGWDAASKLLGIPKFSGTVRIRPGQLGEFKVFIQSTSVNRKLVPGTAVVYLP